MSTRSPRRIAVALALAVVLVGGASIALAVTAPARAASSVASGASGSLSVTAIAGFAFTPNAVQNLPTGANISVTFTDNDAVDHTFTIIGKQGWVIPSSYSASQIDSLAFGSTPSALLKPLNASSVGTSGDQVTGSFTSPTTPGWYEFVCTEPGHFQNGMYGFVAFGENLPGNLTVAAPNTDPGPAVFIIVGTIVALVVIALVLGFVIGRRRGATYEMPPERLGYPEPEVPGGQPVNDSPPTPDEHPKG
jgi:plastocyanin